MAVPVGPMNTMLLARAMNPSTTNSSITARFTPGWRSHGNVSRATAPGGALAARGGPGTASRGLEVPRATRERPPGIDRRAPASAQHGDRVLHLVPHDPGVVGADEQVPDHEVGPHPAQQVVEDAGQSSFTANPFDVVHRNLARGP
jgi:hypothetical protein